MKITQRISVLSFVPLFLHSVCFAGEPRSFCDTLLTQKITNTYLSLRQAAQPYQEETDNAPFEIAGDASELGPIRQGMQKLKEFIDTHEAEIRSDAEFSIRQAFEHFLKKINTESKVQKAVTKSRLGEMPVFIFPPSGHVGGEWHSENGRTSVIYIGSKLLVWTFGGPKFYRELPVHFNESGAKTFDSVLVSPDGKRVLYFEFTWGRTKILIFDAHSLAVAATLECDWHTIPQQFSADSRYLLTRGASSRAEGGHYVPLVWDLQTKTFTVIPEPEHTSDRNKIRMSEDRNVFGLVSENNKLLLWHADKKMSVELDAYPTDLWMVSPDSHFAVLIKPFFTHPVRIIDMHTGEITEPNGYNANVQTIYHAAFTSDSKKIVFASLAGSIYEVDIPTREWKSVRTQIDHNPNRVTALGLTADEQQVLLLHTNGGLEVINRIDGEVFWSEANVLNESFYNVNSIGDRVVLNRRTAGIEILTLGVGRGQ